MNGIKYSVIIPMYNEQEVILESYRRLDSVMRIGRRVRAYICKRRQQG